MPNLDDLLRSLVGTPTPPVQVPQREILDPENAPLGTRVWREIRPELISAGIKVNRRLHDLFEAKPPLFENR